jgi:acetyl esterase/lipase
LLRLAKSASSLTLFKKNQTRKRDVLYSVFSTTAKVATIGYKGVLSFAQGVTQLVKSGPARPSWNSGTHIVLHWLRDALRFEHNSIDAVRRGEWVAGSILSLTASNVSILPTSFEVVKSKLMAYEKDGRLFQASTQSWRYPVPAEDPTHIRDSEILKLNGEWLIPLDKLEKNKMLFSRFFSRSSPRKKCILYLHGGCYIIGTAQIYRNLTSLLAKNNNCPVFALNYRLAPEHPFPAGLNDALAAYIWLLNPKNPMFIGNSSDVIHQSFSPEDIIICGDSAGITYII